ncbi:DUF3841 domain-containing protein [Aerococcus sanguinicola]|uniref:DUF3841 domain-containing protein n=1 Tax=unclassified Aerococcus TaxID=2618060 RepID=UPI0008A55D27|nr:MULTISPECIES: DUF3841 domain-containing protein [unclassified Aerococcus]MDK6232751.1 DUF3841 domain-containing protein [Aerococcus sp. UMB10185]MDK6805300.1 DUF3841 domain-containing protein [Aerococcus sp. UMB7834]MDK6854959.1 DUF3841 domain-containing protein [Aerococcus sp. UMB7533]MDK8501775.1 DUF3841 domain-containing protein [Aerococcus sp. UMB1112A]OFN02717.1 hypothetical protein HMPREF2626_02055 [Aerococcus sp. HMSC062A02]
MQTIALYTRQNEKSLQELKRTGAVRNKEIYVRLHMGVDADHFSERYRCFVEMAEKFVSRPQGVDYPIWCTANKHYCKRPVQGELVYCLQVPREEIIFFDSLKWDYVLNYQYCPKNEADARTFNQKLEALGIQNIVNLFQRKYDGMYEEIKHEIKNSWSRIFDLETKDPAIIEGNIWQIKEEWIQHIVYPGDSFFEIVKDIEDSY